LLTLSSLSEQLYQKSTHFLLEIIQNVDDNSYTQAQPRLNLTFKNRTLRVDCNEVGFSRKNVEAICRIGRSTKAGIDHTLRYIGEKGIGFKSVFKVSNAVWIQSGHYSFKFDKREKLGMIAPIWAEFPEPTYDGSTSILLEIAPDIDTRELLTELKKLDSRLLIFLRKLRSINVAVFQPGGIVWRKSLSREDNSDDEQQQVVTLDNNEVSVSYVITRFPVHSMPVEQKREGCKSSEIMLAFPIGELNHANIGSQQVYTFLPIRDYGFKVRTQEHMILAIYS
jgi:hypothetical protein